MIQISVPLHVHTAKVKHCYIHVGRVGVPKPKNRKYFCFSFKYMYSKNLKNLKYINAFILSFIIVDII